MLEMEINCPILDPVLHIKAGDKTVVETNAFSLVKIAGEISWPIYANTAMPALVWTIPTAEQSVFVFGVKYNASTGANEYITVKSDNFLETQKLKNTDIPVLWSEYALLGYVLVINDTGVNFVWGTTHLDASWVATIFIQNFGFVWY